MISYLKQTLYMIGETSKQNLSVIHVQLKELQKYVSLSVSLGLEKFNLRAGALILHMTSSKFASHLHNTHVLTHSAKQVEGYASFCEIF